MKIFIDADAFPNAIKDIVIRSSQRLNIHLIFVSNKAIKVPKSDLISCIIVDAGADVADDRIVELVNEGDLVITGDIPLADRVVTKGAFGIDIRGELYTKDNIKHLLAMRNLMDEIRSTGEIIGGPKPFSQKDRHEFANQLHRFLTKYCK